MNDNSKLFVIRIKNKIFDVIISFKDFVFSIRKCLGKKKMSCGIFTWNSNSTIIYLIERNFFFGDKKWPNAFAQCASTVEHFIILKNNRQNSIAYFGKIQAIMNGEFIQCFNIFKTHIKL